MAENNPQNRGKTGRKRDDKGRFVVGVSGNPGGRPVRKNIADAIRDFLGETYVAGDIDRGQYLINTLFTMATKREDVSAARLLLQYGFGNPPQQIQLDHTEVPLEERQAAEFVGWLDEHPRNANSYRRYLLSRRKAEGELAGGNGDSH